MEGASPAQVELVAKKSESVTEEASAGYGVSLAEVPRSTFAREAASQDVSARSSSIIEG